VNQRSDISSLELSATGGSTGIPMPYYHDSFHGQFSNAITLRNNHWTGWDIGEPAVELWGSDFDLKLAASLKGKLRNFIDNRLVLSAWDLGEARMGEYLSLFQEFRPQLVTGYTHALYLFSCYLVSRNRQLKPKAVISSAETLFDYQREMMEKAFQCPILNRYGCREVGNIAHQCLKTGGMHINAEMIYLEIIKDNNPCPPGEVGEIVVTCLTNRGMPFIRYAIGDLGAIEEGSCTCGRNLPLLKTVKGRVQDVLVGTSGQFVTGELFPHLLKNFLKIFEYQIIQQERKVLALNLVVSSPLTSTEKERIKAVIHKYLGGDMTVVWNYVDNIVKPPSGKNRTVISDIPKNIGGFRQPE
jgi:phenylacetate-CoA ligase